MMRCDWGMSRGVLGGGKGGAGHKDLPNSCQYIVIHIVYIYIYYTYILTLRENVCCKNVERFQF